MSGESPDSAGSGGIADGVAEGIGLADALIEELEKEKEQVQAELTPSAGGGRAPAPGPGADAPADDSPEALKAWTDSLGPAADDAATLMQTRVRNTNKQKVKKATNSKSESTAGAGPGGLGAGGDTQEEAANPSSAAAGAEDALQVEDIIDDGFIIVQMPTISGGAAAEEVAVSSGGAPPTTPAAAAPAPENTSGSGPNPEDDVEVNGTNCGESPDELKAWTTPAPLVLEPVVTEVEVVASGSSQGAAAGEQESESPDALQAWTDSLGQEGDDAAKLLQAGFKNKKSRRTTVEVIEPVPFVEEIEEEIVEMDDEAGGGSGGGRPSRGDAAAGAVANTTEESWTLDHMKNIDATGNDLMRNPKSANGSPISASAEIGNQEMAPATSTMNPVAEAYAIELQSGGGLESGGTVNAGTASARASCKRGETSTRTTAKQVVPPAIANKISPPSPRRPTSPFPVGTPRSPRRQHRLAPILPHSIATSPPAPDASARFTASIRLARRRMYVPPKECLPKVLPPEKLRSRALFPEYRPPFFVEARNPMFSHSASISNQLPLASLTPRGGPGGGYTPKIVRRNGGVLPQELKSGAANYLGGAGKNGNGSNVDVGGRVVTLSPRTGPVKAILPLPDMARRRTSTPGTPRARIPAPAASNKSEYMNANPWDSSPPLTPRYANIGGPTTPPSSRPGSRTSRRRASSAAADSRRSRQQLPHLVPVEVGSAAAAAAGGNVKVLQPEMLLIASMEWDPSSPLDEGVISLQVIQPPAGAPPPAGDRPPHRRRAQTPA